MRETGRSIGIGSCERKGTNRQGAGEERASNHGIPSTRKGTVLLFFEIRKMKGKLLLWV